MDPISAIGVAAAVAQFIAQGIQVAKKLNEYTSASPFDVPKPLQNIKARLPVLLSALSRMKSEEELSHFDVDSRCILRGVISGCMRLIEDIDQVSRRLVPQPGESFRTKLKKVLASLNVEEKISEIDRSLQTYIQVLILHHVVDKKEFDTTFLQDDGYFEVKERLADPFERRLDLISELDQCFQDTIRRQTDEPQIAVLVGKSGAGKSQLAAGYCREVFDLRHFHLVFWLDGSSPQAYQTGLQTMAIAIRHTRDGEMREKFEFVNKFLADNWEPWLIVIDNYNRKLLPENELLSYLPNKGYGGIIVASESENFSAKSTIIRVPKYLEEEEYEAYRSQMSGAIENSNLETVEKMIAHGLGAKGKVNIGWTFLARAALMGSDPIVRLLLANGADHIPTPDQAAPLYWAARGGHKNTVSMLLDQEQKTQKFLEPDQHREAATAAIADGYGEVARTIVSRCEIKLSGTNQQLTKSFSDCARKGNLETLKFLHSIGALPSKDEDKGNALVAAIENEHVEVVKYLLSEAGFSVNVPNQYGAPGLLAAASLQASHQGPIRNEIVTLFLDAGANVNQQESDGGTALIATALRENVDTVKQLLAAGADATIADRLGFNPLLSAAKYNSPKCFPLLTEIEIPDPAKRAEYFKKALFYSARNGNRELLASVIDKCELDTVEDHSGDTALLLAIKRGHMPVARYLIRRGASPVIKDRDGNLPLLLAAQKDMSLVVRDLAKSKNSPGLQIKDASGNTALHLAAAANRSATVEELLKAGADIDAENTFGEIAMDIAEEKKFKDVIKALEETKV